MPKPRSITLGTGPDTLLLKLSQDAYQGSARYTLEVDGHQIGGTLTAGASHSGGQSDAITVKGDWGSGPHRVEITFLNDLWVPGVGDRNLHLDAATYNDQAVADATLHLMSNGTQAFSFTEGPPAAAPGSGGHHQFFSDASPWNTQVPAGARYQEVAGLDGLADRHAVGLASWDPTYQSVAIHYASPGDPLVEIRWMADTWSPVNGGGVKRSGNGAAVDAALRAQSQDINPFPMNPYSTQHAGKAWNSGGGVDTTAYDEWAQSAPLRVHVPAGALPPPDGDGLMVVVQPDGRALELYSPIRLGDGALVSEMFSLTDSVNGLGTGAENGRRASMVPAYAGAITDQDMQAGAIGHALAVNVPASMLATGYTGPALAFDSDDGYSGALPMGSRLAIPAGLDLAGLGLQTQLGRMMAEAAQHYGVYVVDRGGGGVTVATQHAPRSGPLAGYSDGVQHDLEAIFHAAQLVQPDAVIWG